MAKRFSGEIQAALRPAFGDCVILIPEQISKELREVWLQRPGSNLHNRQLACGAERGPDIKEHFQYSQDVLDDIDSSEHRSLCSLLSWADQ